MSSTIVAHAPDNPNRDPRGADLLVRGTFTDGHTDFAVRASSTTAPDSFQVSADNNPADLVLIVSGINSSHLHATWGQAWRVFAPDWKVWIEDAAFKVFYTGHAIDNRPTPGSGPGPSHGYGPGGSGTVRFCCQCCGVPVEAEPDPCDDGWLGDFRRGPAVFAVFRVGPNNGGHPHLAPEYRIECNDGAGPREICRYTDEPEAAPEWFGAWRGDQWCTWILDQVRRLIADPENT